MCRKLIYVACFALVLGLVNTDAAFGLAINLRIVNGNDDFEESVSSGSMDSGSSDLEFPYESEGTPTGTGEQIIGLRYVNVPIPQSSRITNAYVEIESDETKGGTQPVNLIIEGELTPNAEPFTTTSKNISNRARTTAKVKWSVPNWTANHVKFQTPDISAIIQEIVNQQGWVKGNALVLIFRDDKDNPSAGVRCAEAAEGEPENAPLLHIEFSCKVATNPTPADGARNVMTPLVTWNPGDTAVWHDVYFGTNPTLGTAEFMGRQPFAMYWHAPGIAPMTTYYWRVDEVEADGTTIHSGDVWSFTAAALSACDPDPRDGARYVAVNVVLSWGPGATAITHDVYFGTAQADVAAGTGGTFKGNQPAATYTPAGLLNGTTYYWRIDEVEADRTTKYKGDVWRFTTVPQLVIPQVTITNPDLVGWWKLDEGSGTTAYDWSGYNNHGTLGGDPQWVEGLVGGALELSGNDYVVIDAVDNDVTSTNLTLSAWIKTTQATEGNVFATNDSASGHPLMFGVAGGSPYRYDGGATQYGPAINDGQWHMITYVRSGSTGYIYVDGVQQATYSATYDLSSVTRWSIGQEWDDGSPSDFYRGTVDDARIYRKGLTAAEVKELMRPDPTLPWNPKPANDSTTDIEKALPLTWRPGEKAAKHDVYFGTDAQAVGGVDASDATGIYRGRQDANSYNPPASLEIGKTYYWRIDEFNTDGTISTGNVWSFTVAQYLVVDDFEAYDDIVNRIFDVWTDYFVNGTGATVGHFDPPFAEQTIVHSGYQSMYMRYDNDGTVNEGTSYEKTGTRFYSEAEREWAAPQDWTRKGVTSLTLWFRGIPATVGSFTAGPPMKMTAAGADIWGTADQFHYAYKQFSGVGSITARVVSVSNTNAWAKAGVMIRESLAANSAYANVVVSPTSGVAFQRRTGTGASAAGDTQAGIAAPQWVRLTRSGNIFTAEYSANGTTWTALGTPLTVMMGNDVYIGLCLTSHAAAAACTAEFSNVTTTGTVTGNWQSQDIGIQSNIAEQLYVALQDSANKTAVVKHSDPAATTISTWTEWNIPLTNFTGLNLRAIKKLSIGVGDRTNPLRGSSGSLYIDDIQLRLPPPAQ